MTDFCWCAGAHGVRINHLNKSAMYKIIQSTSVIHCSIERDEIRRLFGIMFK
jgi:hypothetical protein